jgi:hypothetical protein
VSPRSLKLARLPKGKPRFSPLGSAHPFANRFEDSLRVTPFLEVKFFEEFLTGLTRVGLTYFLYNERFARGGGRTHDLSLMKRLLYH